jgi:hypothetical protein
MCNFRCYLSGGHCGIRLSRPRGGVPSIKLPKTAFLVPFLLSLTPDQHPGQSFRKTCDLPLSHNSFVRLYIAALLLPFPLSHAAKSLRPFFKQERQSCCIAVPRAISSFPALAYIFHSNQARSVHSITRSLRVRYTSPLHTGRWH